MLLLGAGALLLAGPWAAPGRTVAQQQPPSCTPDPQLVDAATALLLEDTPPTAASLAEALLAAGSDLPGAQALRAPLGDAAARSRFLRAARSARMPRWCAARPRARPCACCWSRLAPGA
ncbi:MAG: hypothetical protein IPG17_14935 [Sandaracinaceae bacterium]|nr:hypothetical protein [Sandaracinaceae bacterium]